MNAKDDNAQKMSMPARETDTPNSTKADSSSKSPRLLVNALRHFAGLLMGAVGMLFLIGFLFELMEPQTGLVPWQVLLLLITLGGFPFLCAAALLKRSVLSVRHCPCPTCASEERAPAGLLVNTRSWWAWQFGGWLLAMLWGASRERQVRCMQCDTLYFTQTRGTRIAGALLWIVVLWLFILFAIDATQSQ